jgi:DNA invertase Pin-like site-specific DNA recombinase
VTATKIGCARCSTGKQDLEANRQILLEFGVSADQMYLDRAYFGTTRERPGLDQALAAVRAGDTLVVPKLDRLARSVAHSTVYWAIERGPLLRNDVRGCG